MDVVLLRKLSRKSILTFGMNEGFSVQALINLHKQSYLRWIYYNIKGLSFTDDLIEDLRIIEIIKPGTNPELGEKITQNNFDNMKNFGLKQHVKKRVKARHFSKLIKTNKAVCQSKIQLQAINHNHF
jgi:hypothetical protein